MTEILVAVGLQDRGTIMGYRGEGVFIACTIDYWDRLEHAEAVFPDKGYPTRPGLYVWRGDIIIDHGPPDGPYADMRGEFREASAIDIVALMGRHEPPMPVADDDDGRDSPA